MKLTFIRKTAASGDTNCPSLYGTDRGSYVIVGAVVHDEAARTEIGAMLPGEMAVEVPADVIDGTVG